MGHQAWTTDTVKQYLLPVRNRSSIRDNELSPVQIFIRRQLVQVNRKHLSNPIYSFFHFTFKLEDSVHCGSARGVGERPCNLYASCANAIRPLPAIFQFWSISPHVSTLRRHSSWMFSIFEGPTECRPIFVHASFPFCGPQWPKLLKSNSALRLGTSNGIPLWYTYIGLCCSFANG